jgi:hypothetical protein
MSPLGVSPECDLDVQGTATHGSESRKRSGGSPHGCSGKRAAPTGWGLGREALGGGVRLGVQQTEAKGCPHDAQGPHGRLGRPSNQRETKIVVR